MTDISVFDTPRSLNTTPLWEEWRPASVTDEQAGTIPADELDGSVSILGIGIGASGVTRTTVHAGGDEPALRALSETVGLGITLTTVVERIPDRAAADTTPRATNASPENPTE